MKHFYTIICLCTLVFALVACDESSTSDPLPEGTTPNASSKRELIPTPADPPVDQLQPAPQPEYDTESEAAAPSPLPSLPTSSVAEEEADRQSDAGLSHVLPQGWSVGPSKLMRALTLLPGEGFEDVELAVAHWPGGVGSFESNVKRWAEQADVTIDPSHLAGLPKIDIDGQEAVYVPLVNHQSGDAILAMWVPRAGAEVWTFKLKCTAEQALKLEAPFKAWASSVKFESRD